MNIRNQLLITHSKANTQIIRVYIGLNNERLQELMDCFFSNEYRTSQRSAMVVSDIFDHHPLFIEPYLFQLIDNLNNPNQHIAIKRNTLRILQFVTLPEDRISGLFDTCLTYIIAAYEPIAVKAFSMGVLLNICKLFPELKQEVIPVLEIELERNENPGIVSRGNKVLKTLRKL